MSKWFKTGLVPAQAFLLLLSGCAIAPTHMAINDRIPDTEAEVKVEKGTNDNTKFTLNVRKLPNPANVDAAATHYIVWLRPLPGARVPAAEPVTQNVGTLSVSPSFTAKLVNETAFHGFQLFVTAEPLPTMTRPTGDALFWTNVDR